MNYRTFREQWRKVGYFSIYEIKAWNPNFPADSLTRWVKDGLLLRLRRGWYVFPEFKENPDAARIVSSVMCRPSYISLQKALSIYEIIPETVIDITCVTTRPTCHYDNELGRYYYSSVKPGYMFGYKPMETQERWVYYLAEPEKAILDFLYLFPMYKTEQDMLNLRFDEDFMEETLDVEKLKLYCGRMASVALEKRVNVLLNAYGL